jgi:hypothetical protein
MRVSMLIVPILGAFIVGQPSRGAADDASVLTYHGDPARSGRYVVPGLTWARAARAHLDQRFDARLEGHIYAQPLYWQPPGAARGLLIVVTEANMVYALSAETGAEVWHRSVGSPAALSSLPCGNIDPLGITGTPVIDVARRALYFDAMVDQDAGAAHIVYGLSLDDGAVLPGWPINVADALHAEGMAFDPRVQNQRGALTLVGDHLYVPFGGQFGDCGDYHGWVVGFRVSQPVLSGTWKTGAKKGGIWAPGGLSSDGRFLFATTGNTAGAREWGGGEAVIRLPPDLQWQPGPHDFFAPSNWRDLDDEDTDLGGTGPVPIDLTTSHDMARLVLALGKDGNAYLLDRDNLGGIGHPVVVLHVARGAIVTSPAVFSSSGDVFVALQARGSIIHCFPNVIYEGLIALRIGSGQPAHSMHVAWCVGVHGGGAPIVTTSDGSANPIVWVAGAEGDDRLHGFRGDTGETVFDGGGPNDRMANLRHMVTVLAARERLYVAGDGRVYAFTFAP